MLSLPTSLLFQTYPTIFGWSRPKLCILCSSDAQKNWVWEGISLGLVVFSISLPNIKTALQGLNPNHPSELCSLWNNHKYTFNLPYIREIHVGTFIMLVWISCYRYQPHHCLLLRWSCRLLSLGLVLACLLQGRLIRLGELRVHWDPKKTKHHSMFSRQLLLIWRRTNKRQLQSVTQIPL